MFSRTNKMDESDVSAGASYDFLPAGKGLVRIINCRGGEKFTGTEFACVDVEIVEWNNDEAKVGEIYTWYLDAEWASTARDVVRFVLAVEGWTLGDFDAEIAEMTYTDHRGKTKKMTRATFLQFAFPKDASDDHGWAGTEMRVNGRSKESGFVVVKWSRADD
jgi:hypothetical protein